MREREREGWCRQWCVKHAVFVSFQPRGLHTSRYETHPLIFFVPVISCPPALRPPCSQAPNGEVEAVVLDEQSVAASNEEHEHEHEHHGAHILRGKGALEAWLRDNQHTLKEEVRRREGGDGGGGSLWMCDWD